VDLLQCYMSFRFRSKFYYGLVVSNVQSKNYMWSASMDFFAHMHFLNTMKLFSRKKDFCFLRAHEVHDILNKQYYFSQYPSRALKESILL